MKIENLKEGMVLKNYPELCRVLEVDVKAGNSKVAQLNWFEDYFSFRKDGHSFIIKDIYYDKEVEPMRQSGGDTSDNTHIEYIERLILDLLAQDESKGEILLSKTKLFEQLEMVNRNYGACRGRVPNLSQFINVNESDAEEWYMSTSSMLERNLNKALNRLESIPLISWSKKITVCKIEFDFDNAQVELKAKGSNFNLDVPSYKVYRAATDDEVREIIRIENKVIEDLGLEDKRDVVASKQWDYFQSIVRAITLKKLYIPYYWNSYHIIFPPELIKKRAKELKDKLLAGDERREYKDKLNVAVGSKVHSNTIKRSERAKDEIAKKESTSIGKPRFPYKTTRRARPSYVSNGLKLNETLIDSKAKYIVDEVKEINLNNGIYLM